MKRTRKIEMLVGFIATEIIAVGLLFAFIREPDRIETAQAQLLGTQLDDAMTLYAQNCSVCHGLDGDGIGATPPLDNDGLRGTDTDTLFKTIARGRFDTAMPAWSKEDGGPLSDYQISELVALVQSGDWTATQDRVVDLGLAPLVPFSAEPDPAILAQVASLPDGETLQAAIGTYAAECVACHGPDGTGTSLAPALNDPAVRMLTSDELTRTISLGSPGTLMASWQGTLTPEEIDAMVTLIGRWDEIPDGAVPAPDVPVPVTEESLALGETLFAQNCARCHGPEGQGTPRAPALNVRGFLTETSDLAIQQIITLGIPDTSMPVWGDRMTDAEIQAIVGFIRAWEPTAPEVATPTRGGGGGPPWLRDSASATPHQQGESPGQGFGRQTAEDPWWSALDWRIVMLVIAGLSIAISLIAVGYTTFRRSD